MNKNFEFQSPETTSEILEFISQSLKELKLSSKEAVRAELMCEEALVKLIEHGDFTKEKFISVNVKKFLGDVSVDLRVPGKEFEFYINAGISFSDDDSGAIRDLVLRSFSNQIKYKYARNHNSVRITALRSQYSNLYRMLAALILVVIASFVMKNFMSEEITAMIGRNILGPVHNLLLNCLKMCAIPIVFFSIISCFSQTTGGNLSEMKRAGGKMFLLSMFNNIIAVFIGIAVVLIFDVGKGINLTALSNSSVSAAQNASFSLGDTIEGFMPDNFLKPFFYGNMLQLMVLVILFGIAMGAIGSKIIVSVFDEINRIFAKIMELFLHLIPLLVFCSITSMFISTGAKTFQKLGISEKMYSFLVPLGTITCKNCFCLFLSILTLSIANSYGIEVKLSQIFLIGFYSIFLPIAMPGIPGIGLISMSSLLVLAGCPMDGLSVVAVVDPFTDIAHTTSMVMFVLISTLIVAKSENQIDIGKYNS
ncbi:MAG: cation:dicarboxylase symporter family transporter [Synergistaceae bacterium]|nr:cation:dicarboxylase symporter family transporter [Synergistaceae bacterium]